MGVITFNGKASSAYNITVDTCPDYPAAQRKVEFISVDGRSGDLVRDTQAWSNVEQTYSVWYGRNNRTFQQLASDVSMWLLGSKGYCRLEDDYYPDVYRMAVYSKMIQNRNFLNQKGRADLVFNCKPQRYLKSGESWTTINDGDVFVNDYMPCFPVFEVTGNGTVEYGSTLITVTNNSGKTLYIDTELQDAYTGTLAAEPFSVPFDMRTWQMTAAPWYNNIFVPADVDISDYSYLYMLYSTESGSSGMLSIDMSTNFSATVDDWTVTHNVSDNFITAELDGTQIVPVTGKMFTFTGTVASLFNRNEDISISGPMEAFQTGSTEVYHTVSSLKIQPRTWTL